MTKPQLLGLISVIFSCLLVMTYNNCTPSHRWYNRDDLTSRQCIILLEGAFKNGFYQWMRTKDGKKCSGCHVKGGGSEGSGPGYFADDNFDIALSDFRSRVAAITSNAKGSHQGAGIRDPNSELINGFKANYDMAQREYESCVTQGGGNGNNEALSFKTVDKTMGLRTQINPEQIQFTKISFSLETELTKGNPIPTAQVTIDVAHVEEDQGTPVYYFKDPTISTSLSLLIIKGFYISINGSQKDIITWKNLEKTIPINSHGVIISKFTTLITKDGFPTDTLSLSFEDIEVSSLP